MKFEKLSNSKIIPLPENFEFSFVEDRSYAPPSPIADYYFQLHDLSINVSISLK